MMRKYLDTEINHILGYQRTRTGEKPLNVHDGFKKRFP